MFRRCYSSAGAKSAIKPANLEAKIKVSALKNNGIGFGHSVSMVFPIGSRYQGSQAVGASHFLKTFLSLSNQGNSLTYNVRATEILGANWNAFLDRENLIFSIEGPKKKVDHTVDLLLNTWKPLIAKHEKQIAIDANHFELEQARKNPAFIVTDKLYALGFVKGGLANSVLSDESCEEITTDTIRKFYLEAISKSPVHVIGINVSEESLNDLVEPHSASSISHKSDSNSHFYYVDEKSEFNGGQEWHSTNVFGLCDDVVALGFGTTFDKITPEIYAEFLLLQGFLSTSAVTPFGNAVGPLAVNAADSCEFHLVESQGNFAVHKDAAHYSVVATRPTGCGTSESAQSYLKSIINALQATSEESFWTSEKLSVAKAKAIALIADAFEPRSSPLAISLLNIAPSWSANNWIEAIEKSSSGNPAKTCKQLFSQPFNYASIGARASLPHIKQLLP